jgi:hypothetical protein
MCVIVREMLGRVVPNQRRSSGYDAAPANRSLKRFVFDVGILTMKLFRRIGSRQSH